MKYGQSWLLGGLMFFTASALAKSATAEEAWTWFYHKIFLPSELENNKATKETEFARLSKVPFSQLIFSWNAYRPEQGYFSFWVQARNALTGTWGQWHRMMEWGRGVQRSYVSKGDGTTQYLHVRLEAPESKMNGFRIKIIAHQGADIMVLRSCGICVSDFAKLVPEMVDDQLLRLPSVHIIGVPKISQFMLDHERKDSLCSPTSCCMVLGYLTERVINPLECAHYAYDEGLEVYGSWPFNMAHAFERSQGLLSCFTMRMPSFRHVHQSLQRGVPVAVSVRGPLVGAPRPYLKGHLLVVVGFDAAKKEVICHDPAFSCHEEVEVRYPLESFLRAWERSHRLAYMISHTVRTW